MDEHRFLGVALCLRELAPSYRSVTGDAVCSLNRSNEAFSDLLLTASSQELKETLMCLFLLP